MNNIKLMLELLEKIEYIVFSLSWYTNAFELIMLKFWWTAHYSFYLVEPSPNNSFQIDGLRIFIWSFFDHTWIMLSNNALSIFGRWLSQLFFLNFHLFLLGAILWDIFLLMIWLILKKYIKIRKWFTDFIDKYMLIFWIFLRITPVFWIFSTIFIWLSNKSLKEKFLYIVMWNIFMLFYYFIFHNYLFTRFISIHYLIFILLVLWTIFFIKIKNKKLLLK